MNNEQTNSNVTNCEKIKASKFKYKPATLCVNKDIVLFTVIAVTNKADSTLLFLGTNLPMEAPKENVFKKESIDDAVQNVISTYDVPKGKLLRVIVAINKVKNEIISKVMPLKFFKGASHKVLKFEGLPNLSDTGDAEEVFSLVKYDYAVKKAFIANGIPTKTESSLMVEQGLFPDE